MDERYLLGERIKSDSKFDDDELERNTSYFINYTLPKNLEEHSEDGTIESFQTMVLNDDFAKDSYPKIFVRIGDEFKVKMSPDEQDSKLIRGDGLDGYLKECIKHYNKQLMEIEDIDPNQIGTGLNRYDSEWIYNDDGIIEKVPYDKSKLLASESKRLLANPEINSIKRRLKLANVGKFLSTGLGLGGAATAISGAANNSPELGLAGLGVAGLGIASGIGLNAYANNLKDKVDKFNETEYIEIEPNKYYAFDKPLIRSGYNGEVTFNSDISPDSLVGGPYNSRQEARLNRPKAKAIHKGSVVLRYPGFVQK